MHETLILGVLMRNEEEKKLSFRMIRNSSIFMLIESNKIPVI